MRRQEVAWPTTAARHYNGRPQYLVLSGAARYGTKILILLFQDGHGVSSFYSLVRWTRHVHLDSDPLTKKEETCVERKLTALSRKVRMSGLQEMRLPYTGNTIGVLCDAEVQL